MKPKKLLKQIAEHDETHSFIKEWIHMEFPELVNDPQPFKDGELIMSKNGSIVNITDVEKGEAYGFNPEKKWFERYRPWGFKENPHLWKRADPELWKSKLIEECKRRGLDDGNFECLHQNKKNIMVSDPNLWTYDSICDVLFTTTRGGGGKVVYEKGKFATPSIPEYTQEEAEEKFKIKIV